MKVITTLLATVFAINAHAAGGMSSGGGRGVVCRDPNSGKVESVELLDLWEAEVLYQRAISESALPVEIQVSSALDRLKYSIDESGATPSGYTPAEWLRNQLSERADLFLKNSPSVRRLHGVTLEPTPDSNEPVAPTGNCRVEQVVDYIDSEHDPLILVNQDLVDKMTLTDQAALIVHEAFYAFLRDLYPQENGSVRVRRAIGYIFSGHSFPSISTVVGSKYVTCEFIQNSGEAVPSDYSLVYFYMDHDHQMKALRSFNFGEPAIGFFESSYSAAGNFDWLLDGHEFCKNPNNPALYADFPGWGPVDFTETGTLIYDCQNGKFELFISKNDDLDPGNPEISQNLTCQLNEI